MTAPDSSTQARWLAALSDAELRDVAGAAVLARGQAYAAAGAVQSPALSGPDGDGQVSLQATVMGTQPYEAKVWIAVDDEVDGDCDCPHAQDGFFCKHLVALALTLRGLLGGQAPAPDAEAARKVATAAKRAQTQARNRDTLRAFVSAQPAAALAERLWQWAEADRDLMAELKAWETRSRAGDDAPALKSAISDLLRSPRDFLDWRESNSYARRAEQVLALLVPWRAKDPVQLRALCEHALKRLYKVAEHADDSDGEIGGVMQSLMDLLLDTLRAAPPPAAWLRDWFALMAADPWGLWSETAVLDAAGEALRAAYEERAARDWHAWLASHPAPAPSTTRAGPRAYQDYDFERATLRRRYLHGLQRQGDPRAVLQAMLAHVADANEYSAIVAHCEAQGWHREALQHAEAAHKRFAQDWRVEDDLLRCYERDGWDAEALALRRQRLERAPDERHYRAVLDAAERAGHDRAAYRAALFDWAQARERRHGAEADVSVRVSWLLADGDWAAALALLQSPYRCDAQTLHALARCLPASHDAQAAGLLQRLFDAAMSRASSPYREPLALVSETLARMDAARGHEWLAQLRAHHKAKRNFIKALPTRP